MKNEEDVNKHPFLNLKIPVFCVNLIKRHHHSSIISQIWLNFAMVVWFQTRANIRYCPQNNHLTSLVQIRDRLRHLIKFYDVINFCVTRVSVTFAAQTITAFVRSCPRQRRMRRAITTPARSEDPKPGATVTPLGPCCRWVSQIPNKIQKRRQIATIQRIYQVSMTNLQIT